MLPIATFTMLELLNRNFFAGELNQHELDFLHFSADGDIDGLRNLFTEQGYYLFHLDVNCVDSLDRTALSLATINNHVDAVKFILNEVGRLQFNVLCVASSWVTLSITAATDTTGTRQALRSAN